MATTILSTAELTAQLRAAGANLVEARGSAPAGNCHRLADEKIVSAVVDALAHPVDFPPLAQATVPGDRVAIAIDEAVPCLELVASGVVEACRQAGVDDDLLSLVVSDLTVAHRLAHLLPAIGGDDVEIVTHHPDDENELCYVATTETGATLLINRTLFDADVVLPIGCWRMPGVLGSTGVFGCLYPRFADAKTIRTWRGLSDDDAALRRQADEAGWLLGVPMVMSVVPAFAAGVLQVVVGEPSSVARQADKTAATLWSKVTRQPVSLVIATLENSNAQNSWDDVARSVHAANSVRRDDGAIAICCGDLDPPGKSLRRLVDIDDMAQVSRRLAKDRDADTCAARQLLEALDRGPVYLLAGLDPAEIEEIGLAPVAGLEELARLAGRHASCLVLEGAQHVVARLATEADE